MIMDEQLPLLGMDVGIGDDADAGSSTRAVDLSAPPRLRRVDRQQVRLIDCSLDELLADDHPARLMWQAVNLLGLPMFEEAVVARGSGPGRAATDPRILLTLWLYATLDGVGSGREIDRLIHCHDAYRWIVGGVSLNYHTINDFRVEHGAALDDLFTRLLARLLKADLVQINRVSQDGLRVRASAGSASFRREPTLEQLQTDVQEQIEALKQQNDPSFSKRKQAKQLADAQHREQRLADALKQLPEVQQKHDRSAKRKCKPPRPARASSTDPDARIMRMPDGGTRPGYNVQLACDVDSRAIVGVDVTNSGSDAQQSGPMREQIEQRTGEAINEHLYDGGFVSLDGMDQATQAGVTVYAPVPKHGKKDPHTPKPGDSAAVAAWRTRMAQNESKAIYKERAATIETINADLREHRELRQFPVRGSPKVKCIALLFALTYNLMHFAPALLASQNCA